MNKMYLVLVLLMFAGYGHAQTRNASGRILGEGPQLCPPSATPDGVLLYTAPPVPGEKILGLTTIGNTWYDTQTYNAGNLMNRVYEYPDGTIGATWMHQGAQGTPDRGSAYNYFTGTAWTGQVPHLGSDPRNGHPCYQPWGPNGEIIAHYQYIAGDGVIKLLKRETKGTGTWQETILYPPEGNYSLVWHSMVTSGPNHEYIHILAYVYDDPYMGQDDALLYYRSSDGGESWDINGVIIDGLDASYFPTISSLRYTWAQPVGNTIAFTYGFDHFDGLIFKSEDNGTTWEKIKVYEAPYSPFDLPDISNIFGGGDGSSAIVLDSQGKAHIAFSRMLHIYDVVSNPPGGWYFYPATEGMIYWNESMPMLDSTVISSYTLENLEAWGNLVGWVVPDTGTITLPTDQPNYGVGLTSGPQLGIDADDNLFLAWSALAPLFSNGDFFFRHIYSNGSFDGGESWTGIKDMTGTIEFSGSECVYPAIAPIVDDEIQLVFQEDFTPGTGSGEENLIDHMNFPKEFFVGISSPEQPAIMNCTGFFPNPAREFSSLEVILEQASDIKISISTIEGKVVRHEAIGTRQKGRSRISVDLSGMAPGIYFCTISSGTDNVTKKLILQ